MNTAATMMILGAFFLPHETVYRWQSYSIKGDTLYALKTVSIKAINIPIPERGGIKVLEKKYQVVKIDLTGQKQEPVSINYRLEPKQPIGNNHLNDSFGYYEYIELNDNAPPILWGHKELKDRLMKADGVACTENEMGNVDYDSQDSRVFYLKCRNKNIAYRIELPSMHAAAIPLGEAAGLPSDNGPSFYSTLGQNTVFISTGREAYEIAIGSKNKAKKIETIESGIYSPRDRSKKSLIGVAKGLRIYQLSQFSKKTAQLSVEYDQQAPRIFPLPMALVTFGYSEARYLPRNNLMMWEVEGEIMEKKVIYTVNLDSGVVHRTVVSDVE
ncbi:MAG: hypothetical protein V4495_00995 [Pseudomonadota bacterium]